eukprot:scaffold408_cov71-Cylindrotheca_fusiformis.AAC.31
MGDGRICEMDFGWHARSVPFDWFRHQRILPRRQGRAEFSKNIGGMKGRETRKIRVEEEKSLDKNEEIWRQ